MQEAIHLQPALPTTTSNHFTADIGFTNEFTSVMFILEQKFIYLIFIYLIYIKIKMTE